MKCQGDYNIETSEECKIKIFVKSYLQTYGYIYKIKTKISSLRLKTTTKTTTYFLVTH